jgi:RNA polymerase sigma-70 factor, ECF subfamily
VSGNAAELRELYEKYALHVHRRARQLVGNESDAWDVVQNVFVRIFESPSAFRGEARPMTYLYRVTTNLSLNLLRAKAIRQAAAPEVTAAQQVEPDAQAEARNLLMALASRLDDRQLNIAALHYAFGLLQEEIAEVLGLSRKTIGKELAEVRQVAATLSLDPEVGHG